MQNRCIFRFHEYTGVTKHITKFNYQVRKFCTSFQGDDDLVLETYYHASGNVVSCIYQGGQRFYMDWQTQDWVPFPKKWYKEGVLVTENIIGQNDQVSICAPQTFVYLDYYVLGI